MCEPGGKVVLQFMVGTEYFSSYGADSGALCAEVAAKTLAALLTVTATLVTDSMEAPRNSTTAACFACVLPTGKVGMPMRIAQSAKDGDHLVIDDIALAGEPIAIPSIRIPVKLVKGIRAPMELALPGNTSVGRPTCVTDEGVVFISGDPGVLVFDWTALNFRH